MRIDDLAQYPFYTHPCDEVLADHARHVIVHQYVACLKIASEWVVPTNEDMSWLDIPAVVDVLIGSCLWNPTYGFFRVVAFDKTAQRIAIQTKTSLAAEGTVVPACTKFILTPDV